MAEVLLLEHAQGQTRGVLAFADELRQAGHTVHDPDLYDGRTFDSLDESLNRTQYGSPSLRTRLWGCDELASSGRVR